MTVEITAPDMGESIDEGVVVAWFKKVGEQVLQGEDILEMETEKVLSKVPAPVSGILSSILKSAEDTIQPGETLGTISEAMKQPVDDGSQSTGDAPEQDSTPLPETTAPITPLAANVAELKGLDLANVQGTGPGNRITKEDVLRTEQEFVDTSGETASISEPAADMKGKHTEDLNTSPSAPSDLRVAIEQLSSEKEVQEVPLTRRQFTMSRRMAEVQRTAVMTTTYNEVDMSEILALRTMYREEFQSKHGVHLRFMSFAVAAVVMALEEFPILNSRLLESSIRYYTSKHIGIAVATDDGLVVPVMHNADRKTFPQLEAGIASLAERARNKSLTINDLQNGTFAITNGGVFGSLFSTPILNPPQVGILGMHAIQKRAVVVGEEIQIRPMMYLAVTYDHRIVEGAIAVQFLGRIKQMLEQPARLLLSL